MFNSLSSYPKHVPCQVMSSFRCLPDLTWWPTTGVKSLVWTDWRSILNVVKFWRASDAMTSASSLVIYPKRLVKDGKGSRKLRLSHVRFNYCNMVLDGFGVFSQWRLARLGEEMIWSTLILETQGVLLGSCTFFNCKNKGVVMPMIYAHKSIPHMHITYTVHLYT